jgi:hypothetical protein
MACMACTACTASAISAGDEAPGPDPLATAAMSHTDERFTTTCLSRSHCLVPPTQESTRALLRPFRLVPEGIFFFFLKKKRHRSAVASQAMGSTLLHVHVVTWDFHRLTARGGMMGTHEQAPGCRLRWLHRLLFPPPMTPGGTRVYLGTSAIAERDEEGLV